jgi:hypothetical protein
MSSLQINQSVSLYIPRVSSEITKEQVAYVFESNLFGIVSRVDFISKTDFNDHYYNAAYIHFKQWNNTVMVHNFQEKLMNYMNGVTETPVRVVYNDPYYWNVFINKSNKNIISGQRKICLDLSDFSVGEKAEKITTNEMGAYLLSILKNNSSLSVSY